MKRMLGLAMLACMLGAPLAADVTAIAVKGSVGVMLSGRLQPVSVGMRLNEDATVVTGANSEVSFSINNGTITLKSLTTAKINSVAMTSETSTADVALRNGTVVSNVQQIQGLRTNFTVTTPVATSSVRGTTHTVSFSPERGMEVAVSNGLVAVTAARSGTRPVAAGSSYTKTAPAAAPQVVSTAVKEAALPAAGNAFASAEEAAVTLNLESTPAVVSELVSIIAPVPVPPAPTSGTVDVTIIFP